MKYLFLLLSLISSLACAQFGDPEFDASYALCQQRYSAMYYGSPQSVAPVVPTMQYGNFVQNSRFIPFGRPLQATITSGGAVYPDQFRVAPGPNATITARLEQYDWAAITASGQGNSLYLRWTLNEWDPWPECGSTFLEHYIYELDQVLDSTIRISFWAAVDVCSDPAGCVELVPCIWINWHNNDYEFMFGAPVMVSGSWQKFETYFYIPPAGAHIMSEDRYIAIGMTTRYPTAPGLHLRHFEMVR